MGDLVMLLIGAVRYLASPPKAAAPRKPPPHRCAYDLYLRRARLAHDLEGGKAKWN